MGWIRVLWGFVFLDCHDLSKGKSRNDGVWANRALCDNSHCNDESGWVAYLLDLHLGIDE